MERGLNGYGEEDDDDEGKEEDGLVSRKPSSVESHRS